MRILRGLALLIAVAFAAPALAQYPTPAAPFESQSPPSAPDYAAPQSWAVLPDRPGFSTFAPAGVSPATDAKADVFFIHPTTYLSGETWNAAHDHPAAALRVDELVIKNQASVFNGAARIFAPRYRQASLAAFGSAEPEGRKALELAYQDVKAAFENFIATRNAGRPFLIASHSQGSRFALWLLQDVVEKDPVLLERFVAAYVVGYAIPDDVFTRTLTHIKPCLSVSDTRCLVGWSTYDEGADPSRSTTIITHRYPGGVWESNAGKALQCTNPLAWTEGESPDWAPATLDRGALLGAGGDAPLPALVAGQISARCAGGVLRVRVPEGHPLDKAHAAGNYHNLDYALFYGAIRRNVAGRIETHVRGAPAGMVIDRDLTPPKPFDETEPPPAPDYASPDAWAALPWRKDYADFVPAGERDGQADAKVDVLFFYPTTFLFNEGWNSPYDHPIATARVDYGVLKHQASAYNGSARVFAPRYRQSTLVSFYPQSRADGQKAQAFAYADVKRAFEYYMEHYNEGRPFILASHSQGTRHLIFLLSEVLENHPAKARMIAAYAIGYPLPLSVYGREYPTIRPCARADDLGCVVNYGVWGEPGPRPPARSAEVTCVNPLSWAPDGAKAPAAANRGALVGSPLQEPLPAVVPGVIGAQCREGILWADVPEGSRWHAARQPPNNYHNQDYSLFYMNIRENVQARIDAYFATAGR